MTPQLLEDEIDDLLYFARTGELQEFSSIADELCKRESTTLNTLLSTAKDPYSGNGPAHMAAANGHSEVLTAIIKALSGQAPQNPVQLAILNMQNEAGNTALHWAALNGHLECVKVLLNSGADPTITNDAGHDAVYEAELNDKREVVEWVLKEGGEGLEEGIVGGAGAEEEGVEDVGVEETTSEEAIGTRIDSLSVEDGMEDS